MNRQEILIGPGDRVYIEKQSSPEIEISFDQVKDGQIFKRTSTNYNFRYMKVTLKEVPRDNAIRLDYGSLASIPLDEYVTVLNE